MSSADPARRPDWFALALCRGLPLDPDPFFEPDDLSTAKAICMACPVQAECLRDGLAGDVADGIWGGFTSNERREILVGRFRPCEACGVVLVPAVGRLRRCEGCQRPDRDYTAAARQRRRRERLRG